MHEGLSAFYYKSVEIWVTSLFYFMKASSRHTFFKEFNELLYFNKR